MNKKINGPAFRDTTVDQMSTADGEGSPKTDLFSTQMRRPTGMRCIDMINMLDTHITGDSHVRLYAMDRDGETYLVRELRLIIQADRSVKIVMAE